eukprot:GGOE01003419.1.p1 GENE.GGOE01003419.1~~GGOE01003419.1.p1  ORF type:complete len:237 (-),score=43.93 GGOE01003419.1:746-1363(-)
MNHVYNGIWIGGRSAVNSSSLMQSGIHNVVNAAAELMDGSGMVDWGDLSRNGIAVQHVPLDDTPAQRLVPPSPSIQAALQFIHECVSANAPVLVNCAMGASRSPSLVIAYLMLYHSMSYDEAYGIVLAGRPSAKPNAGFQSQLRQLGGGRGPYRHGQPTPMFRPPVPSHVPMPGPSMFMVPGPEPYAYQEDPWSLRGFLGRLRQY